MADAGLNRYVINGKTYVWPDDFDTAGNDIRPGGQIKQSRKMSGVESLANVAIGYGVATAANIIVLPWFGFNVSLKDGAIIGVVFTAISIVRSYVLRRAFEAIRVWKE